MRATKAKVIVLVSCMSADCGFARDEFVLSASVGFDNLESCGVLRVLNDKVLGGAVRKELSIGFGGETCSQVGQ